MKETGFLKTKFLTRIDRTPDIVSFRFQPEEKFDFLAGQFTQIMFDPGNPANRDLNKYLSFSSVPGYEYFEVTKRLSTSLFSQHLRNLKPGEIVLIKKPMGNCVIQPDYRKIAFLVGGIGITPVVSLVGSFVSQGLSLDTFVFYSNRTDDSIAFRDEFDLWQENNKLLNVIYTVTDCTPKDDSCVSGAISTRLIGEKCTDFLERVIFIFGPPRMVEAMRNLSLEFGCRRENIKTEGFVGYE